MKVYYLYGYPFRANDNPYVGTLINGIKDVAQDIEIGFGLDKFWDEALFDYDLLHINWPDILLSKDSTLEDVGLFVDRLVRFKAGKGKIIVTCHNLQPHYCKNDIREAVYKKVYGIADVMIHLGRYSQELMKTKYPHVKHVLCFHHTYDSLYCKTDRESSLKKLHLNPDIKYILCFGDFRDDEEREIVDEVARYFHSKKIELLAPGYYRIAKRRNFLMLGCQWLKVRLKELMTPGLHIYGWFVPNDLLPYFYGASDVALIQRKKILNSGNLPLGFYFGKVVVGPNVGNVGEILESTGNPTFLPDDNDSIIDAVNKAFELHKYGKGLLNSQYAEMNFSTHIICKKMYEIYESTLNKNS